MAPRGPGNRAAPLEMSRGSGVFRLESLVFRSGCGYVPLPPPWGRTRNEKTWTDDPIPARRPDPHPGCRPPQAAGDGDAQPPDPCEPRQSARQLPEHHPRTQRRGLAPAAHPGQTHALSRHGQRHGHARGRAAAGRARCADPVRQPAGDPPGPRGAGPPPAAPVPRRPHRGGGAGPERAVPGDGVPALARGARIAGPARGAADPAAGAAGAQRPQLDLRPDGARG